LSLAGMFLYNFVMLDNLSYVQTPVIVNYDQYESTKGESL